MSRQSARIGKALALLQMGRFKFLAYSPILYGIGAASSMPAAGNLNAGRYFLGLMVVLITHAMTHYCNEYFDFATDSANMTATSFTGGSRVLVRGLLPRRSALAMAIGLTVVSAGLLLVMPNWPARVIVLCALALAWSYNAPPLRLVGRGFGELTVVLVLNLLTPLMGSVMQSGRVEASLFAALAPLCLIGFIRMLIMSIPDREGDAQTNKRTFVVRFGLAAGIRIHTIGMLAAYSSIVGLLRVGMQTPVAVCLFLTVPLAAWHTYRVATADWRKPGELNARPFWASTHNATVALGVLVGMTIARVSQPSSIALSLFPLVLYVLVFFLLRYSARSRTIAWS